MAADSAATLDNLYIPEKIPKLIRIAEHTYHEMLIGCVGSSRVIQIIDYHLRPELEDNLSRASLDFHGDTMKYMVTKFVPDLKGVLAYAGYISSVDEKESGVSLLIGAAGRLFNVMSDYQVSEPACGYDAIGSFAAISIALGSLRTTNAVNVKVHARDRVELAVEAAIYHDINCGGDITMEVH
jgi:hypothetical protein